MIAQSRTGTRRALSASAVLLALLVFAAGCGGTARRTERAGGTAAARPPVTTGPPPATTAPPPATIRPTAATTTRPTPATTRPTPATRPPTTPPATIPPQSTTGPAPTTPAAPVVRTLPPSSCPANLAASLASTGSARELITVVAPDDGGNTATVQAWQRSGLCWEAAAGPWTGSIGYNGFSDHHREGDGTTPTGIYGIGPVMYGNAPNPGVQEPYHQLVCGDWWDEDPRSPSYNTFQHVPCGTTPPFGGGSEALWTETAPYPSFAVVDYNTGPIIPYAGSAIFLHAATGTATDGCVSIPLPGLDQVLRWINPNDSPAIVMGPTSEIQGF